MERQPAKLVVGLMPVSRSNFPTTCQLTDLPTQQSLMRWIKYSNRAILPTNPVRGWVTIFVPRICCRMRSLRQNVRTTNIILRNALGRVRA